MHVRSSLSESRFSYDNRGRVAASTQVTPNIENLGCFGSGNCPNYNFSYVYNLDGTLKKQTYPSGRSADFTYDPGSRL